MSRFAHLKQIEQNLVNTHPFFLIFLNDHKFLQRKKVDICFIQAMLCLKQKKFIKKFDRLKNFQKLEFINDNSELEISGMIESRFLIQTSSKKEPRRPMSPYL